MSADHTLYTILEGTPMTVSIEAERLMLNGWICNGELFYTKISDTVIAFQGMIKTK
jgi:hypothetical protein